LLLEFFFEILIIKFEYLTLVDVHSLWFRNKIFFNLASIFIDLCKTGHLCYQGDGDIRTWKSDILYLSGLVGRGSAMNKTLSSRRPPAAKAALRALGAICIKFGPQIIESTALLTRHREIYRCSGDITWRLSGNVVQNAIRLNLPRAFVEYLRTACK